MAGFQQVTVLGRLGQDPELTTTQGGMQVAKFSIATSRKDKQGQEKTSWHRCTAFNKTAELVGQYVKKGDQLLIQGELNYGSYEKDGITRYTTDIIILTISFVGKAQQQTQQQQQQQQGGNLQQWHPPQQQQQTQQQQQNQNEDDDIPF